jgi:hypothetical protein
MNPIQQHFFQAVMDELAKSFHCYLSPHMDSDLAPVVDLPAGSIAPLAVGSETRTAECRFQVDLRTPEHKLMPYLAGRSRVLVDTILESARIFSYPKITFSKPHPTPNSRVHPRFVLIFDFNFLTDTVYMRTDYTLHH